MEVCSARIYIRWVEAIRSRAFESIGSPSSPLADSVPLSLFFSACAECLREKLSQQICGPMALVTKIPGLDGMERLQALSPAPFSGIRITQATNTGKAARATMSPTATTRSACSTTVEQRAVASATWRLVATSVRSRVSEIDPSIAHAHTRGGRIPLSLESAGSESLKNLFANICGQCDLRKGTSDVCNRPA